MQVALTAASVTPTAPVLVLIWSVVVVCAPVSLGVNAKEQKITKAC